MHPFPPISKIHPAALYRWLALAVVFSLLISACNPKGPAPEETLVSTPPTPSAQATPTLQESDLQVVDPGDPLPPQVVERTPQGAQELSLEGEIRLVFDQPMDAAMTAAAWQVVDAEGSKVDGELAWLDERSMGFTPSQPYSAGVLYRASLDENASSAAGVAISEPYSFQFITTGALQVNQAFPADGASQVASDAVITVIFNRPVVPLVIAEEQANLPNPLRLDPPVEGKGEWVNTSIFTFTPSPSLKGGTMFTASIQEGLQDAAGESSLAQTYTWKFTTALPAIESFSTSRGLVNPPDFTQNILLDEAFTISFLQAMNRQSVEDALSLTPMGAEQVDLESAWNGTSTAVVITPTQRLELDTQYLLELSTSALAADSGQLSNGLSWNFSTIPPPAIVGTTPADGGLQDYYSSELFIKFASPMRIDSVKSRIQISPKPEEEFEWWYNDWDWSMVGFMLEPSTRYEVRFLAGMQDIYGNATSQEQVIRFTTAPHSPSASLLMPYEPALMRANGPEGAQQFYVQYRNVSQVSLALHSLTVEQFTSFTQGRTSSYDYRPSSSTLVWSVVETNRAAENENTLANFQPKAQGEDRLAPGFYFLGLDAPELVHSSPFADHRLFIVAGASLTLKTSTTGALAWLTDLETGQPVSGAPVTIYNASAEELGSAVSDRDGLAEIPLPAPDDPYEPRLAFSQGEHFAFVSSSWGSGVSLWDYGAWSSYFAPANQPTAYLYTDRPIYRPGQPVYFKGIVRLDDDLDYSLPEDQKVQVKISIFSDTIYDETLELNNNGSFEGKLSLDQEAALGYAMIEVFLPGREGVIGSVIFNIAEYRRPEFQVQVSAEPGNVLAGENIEVQVSADYYSGGGVGDALVSWSLTSDPFAFIPPAEYSGYNFQDYEEDLYRYDFAEDPSEVIAEGQGRTGPDGLFKLDLPADLSKYKSSRSLTFEATVTDLTTSAVSGRATVIAHASAVYPGIRSAAYIGTSGEEQSFELVALDWDGSPLPGQKVSVEIVERRWYSVQTQDPSGRVAWESTVEDIPVASFDEVILDQKGRGSVAFTPPNGGVFRARITALDEQGNAGSASAYLWVAGDVFIPWAQTNDRSFDLITDKKSYLPGESAQVLIASPFQGKATALVTVERGRIRYQDVIELETNSTLYELPITPDFAPNVYISVVVMKGVDENNPRPTFKMGVEEIQVDTRQQELAVELSVDPPAAGPGEQVRYTVRTLDGDGKPVSAEVSLSLSDLATLSLMPPNAPRILDFFYSERTLGVWTSIPISSLIDEFNVDIADEVQQGEGQGSGGGKGEDSLGVVEVRQDFPDTAFWDAFVQTNAQGEASVSLTLPDTLTTWRMDARAATPDTRVGQATLDLISSLPLLVRPQTPRFFIAGDQVRLGAALHNNTTRTVSGAATLEAEGLTLKSPASQEVEIPPRSQVYVTWEASVNLTATRVDLVFSVESENGLKDASRPPAGTLDNQGLPVYRYSVPETVGTAGQMRVPGTLVEGISLPGNAGDAQGELTVRISPSLAAGMTDGLTYLEHYPYECIEQTISRFLPNVISSRAYQEAGLSDPELEAGLDEQVSTALQRLYNWQNPDGGWGWWSNQKSDSLTSAYVVLGLVEAGLSGYTVEASVLDDGLNYLRTQLPQITGLTDPELVHRQAFILYVLARAGQPDVSKSVQLYDQRQRMAYYARAYLAQTLYIIDSEDTRIATILSDLNSAAILSASGTHWEEEAFDRLNWNTDTRTTAIVLSALSLIDPSNPINANAVRWLMSSRTGGHWQGTQETAWTLMALANWMSASGELQANYEFAVALNGERLGGGVANQESLRENYTYTADLTSMLQDEVNRLAIAYEGGPGNLYYTTHLNIYLPVEEVQPLDAGIAVSRSYYRLTGLQTPVEQAQQGELLLARLTVVAPNALHYVVIDDPLPAGLEAVDQSLSTSPQSVEVPQAYSPDDALWRGWGWWYFDHIQYRDERVVLSASYLPAGTYVFTYLVRAGTVGVFQTVPTIAQEFYFPEVYGRGAGALFTVTP